MGKKQIGKSPFNPGHRRKPGRLERRVIWQRHLKRYMFQKGLITKKEPIVWLWTCGKRTGFVSAFTRSEARARTKEIFGCKNRLPINVTIEKVKNESDVGISVEETSVCSESES